jgi:hypothetical protein
MSEEVKGKFPCKKLEELPVVSEWQNPVLCPACGHYCKGKCANPNRTSAADPCPFDGKQLPVQEVKDAQ